MKNLISTLAILLCVQQSFGQMNAITENGDAVILQNDGTWRYVNDSNNAASTPIAVNTQTFSKNATASFLVKSNKFNIGLWLNPKSWSFKKGTETDAYEYQFHKKGDDLYGMMITEKIQIPIEALKEVAIENAKNAAPDLVVTKQELRNVNGIQVLMMQMNGTIQGIRFTYFGYYYSNENGTVQLLTYSSETLMKGYHNELEALLNGFVEL
jgi:hypothetical protein